jgi:hypothetical protein
MDDDLVEEARFETLSGDVGAQDDHVPAVRRFLGDRDRFVDADVQESAGDALHDRSLGGRIVAQHEERAVKGTAVEPQLVPVLHVLGTPADQQRARGSHDLGHRSALSGGDSEDPSHVVVKALR